MCKEQTRINGNYVPFGDVMEILSSPDTKTSPQLAKLWGEFIGHKVEIDFGETETKGTICKKVAEMFTTDSIAYKLMTELIMYHPHSDKIIVKQDDTYVGITGKPDDNIMAELIKTECNPVLILNPDSSYGAIISTHPETSKEDAGKKIIIDLHFWDIVKEEEEDKNNKSNSYIAYRDVQETLLSPHISTHPHLAKLWGEFIGQKVEIDFGNSEDKDFFYKQVTEMFSTDPIAYKLMSELVMYMPHFDKIIVKQDDTYVDIGGNSNTNSMIALIKKAIKPVLVLEPQSSYCAIISTHPISEENATSEDIIDLHFWNLSELRSVTESFALLTDDSDGCEEWFEEGESSIYVQWTDFTRNKILIFEPSSQKAEITNNLTAMFSKDTIAARLLNEVVHYNTKSTSITVKQDYPSGIFDKQSLADLVFFMRYMAVKPQLILEHDSNFAVVLSSDVDEKNTILHIWDLRNCV